MNIENGTINRTHSEHREAIQSMMASQTGVSTRVMGHVHCIARENLFGDSYIHALSTLVHVAFGGRSLTPQCLVKWFVGIYC